MSKYDKMRLKQNSLTASAFHNLGLAKKGATEIASDCRRVAEIYRTAPSILDDIDKKFLTLTHMDQTDVAFLLVATALQITRWFLFAELSKTLDDKIEGSRLAHNDKSILQMEKKQRAAFIEDHNDLSRILPVVQSQHRSWQEIVLDSVPYDITVGSPLFGINMHAGFHRMHTLGHDPVLGWLFGTVNILSDTITLDKTYLCRTFNVEMRKKKQWVSETNLIYALSDAIESVEEDEIRLPAGIFAQALHLKSDVFTKLGLPVPILETFDPAFAGILYRQGYDSMCLAKDLAVNSAQAVIAHFINLLIILLHGLFFDPCKHESRDLYEVKTRKILSYSNLIATSSNIVTVAGMSMAAICSDNMALGKKAMSTLDVGGLLVTANRLISDTAFIRNVKREFIENEWYNMVVGNEYQFMAEVQK